jgi:hypothetical protein
MGAIVQEKGKKILSLGDEESALYARFYDLYATPPNLYDCPWKGR